MMKKKLKMLANLAVIALSGCATQKIVYVPTPVKSASITLPNEPDYPVDALTKADYTEYAKVGKAYVTSLKMCRKSNELIREQIEKTNG